MTSFLPVFLALIMMFMGVPVAVALLGSALFYFSFLTSGYTLTSIVQSMVSSAMSTTMLAAPFFIVVGVVMNYSGITTKLLNFCDQLVGHKEGGLGYVNVLLSTLNGGICGSASADAALQCKILVPEMTKHGYPLAFSSVVTAASGLITPIIPPGVSLILYAVIAGVSVGKMFAAGYIPGIMLCMAMLIVVRIYAKKYHWKGERKSRASRHDILISLRSSIWAFLIPIVMIVGIRFGFFTATEGGAVIIILCLLIGAFVYKTIRWEHIPKILYESFHSIASINLLIISSLVFSVYLSWERVPQRITEMFVTMTDSSILFMLIVNLMLLVFGMFLDGTALLMIMTPLLYPAAQAFGFDLVAFGIVIIINIAIGSLTPPFGGVMYVTCSLTKTSLTDFMKYSWAFIAAMLLVLISLIVFPELVTFIPNLIY